MGMAMRRVDNGPIEREGLNSVGLYSMAMVIIASLYTIKPNSNR